jgi:hypothetical protein
VRFAIAYSNNDYCDNVSIYRKAWTTQENTENCRLELVFQVVDQAVSCRIPTSPARVRAQVRSCWNWGEQSGTGPGFLRVLQFSTPILIPPTAPHYSTITRGWYNRPSSGRRFKWTQSHLTPNKWKRSFKLAKSITEVVYVFKKQVQVQHLNAGKWLQ